MAGLTNPPKRLSFAVVRQNAAHTNIKVTSSNPRYSREQAEKDLGEVEALICEGKFQKLKAAKGPGLKAYRYKFVLSDGRQFRHGTNVPLQRN